MKRDKINIKNYHKIDLFSLGIMLYRLAFGFYPFNLQREDVDNDDIILSKINSDFKVENIETEFSKYFIDFSNAKFKCECNLRIISDTGSDGDISTTQTNVGFPKKKSSVNIKVFKCIKLVYISKNPYSFIKKFFRSFI